MKNSISLLVLLVLLLGCSSENPQDISSLDTAKTFLPDFSTIKTENVFVYECEDSLQFTTYVNKDSTWLFLPDTSLKITRARSGSGAKYRGGHYLYWSKENEALLQMPTGSLMNCTLIPQERSWEAARLRGIDFRAMGQEPGWHLEIKDGNRMRYIGNYGEDTVVVATPKRITNAEGHTLYEISSKTHDLVVKIIDPPCTDSMSGFKFPITVSLTVDGKTYQGCGRWLSPKDR